MFVSEKLHTFFYGSSINVCRTLYGWHIECFYLKIRQEIQIKSILLNMGWLCVCVWVFVVKDDPSVHIFPMYILLFSQFYDLCLHIFTCRSFLSFLPLLDFDIRSTITQSKHTYIHVHKPYTNEL